MPLERPSTPSIQLIAFVIPTIQRSVKGIAMMSGSASESDHAQVKRIRYGADDDAGARPIEAGQHDQRRRAELPEQARERRQLDQIVREHDEEDQQRRRSASGRCARPRSGSAITGSANEKATPRTEAEEDADAADARQGARMQMPVAHPAEEPEANGDPAHLPDEEGRASGGCDEDDRGDQRSGHAVSSLAITPHGGSVRDARPHLQHIRRDAEPLAERAHALPHAR